MGAETYSTLYRGAARVDDSRERIVRVAYDLFSRFGVNAIGVDRIIATAGVAKMTLYRNFASKDELALAVLKRREERWIHGWIGSSLAAGDEPPQNRLLGVFDIFDAWFHRSDYEGCLFARSLLEDHPPSSPVLRASVAAFAEIRKLLRGVVEEAEIARPEELAGQWHGLMMGSIILAMSGDLDAAQRARRAGGTLLQAVHPPHP